MRRQLRANGGITNLRQGYGLGDFVRKLIPNELADVASKAAPFVAPFNPLAAGIMRGVGRYDKRGSLKDALKQGLATTALGAGARYLGGQRGMGDIMGGGLRGGLTNPISADSPLRDIFKARELTSEQQKIKDLKEAKSIANTPDFVKGITESTIGKAPLLNKLPPMVQQKLLVGTIVGGAEALYNYFADTIEPEEGESPTEYMARRDAAVRKQMRIYMDSYYTPLVNPQYAAMSSEEKDAFIEKVSPDTTVNMNQGGRVGLAMGSEPLPEDPTKPINPFGPKPTGPVLPDNSMMADLDAVRDSYSQLMFNKDVIDLTPEELEEFEILFKMEYYGKKPTAPNIRMASNDQNTAQLERLYEDFLEMGLSPEAAADAARKAFERMQDDFTSAPEGIRSTIAAQGGRIGYDDGTMNPALKKKMMEILRRGKIPPHKIREEAEKELRMEPYIKERMGVGPGPILEAAQGGRVGLAIGSPEKQLEAGAPPIMYSGNMDPNEQAGLPSVPGPIQMAEDGPEFDMRENGGFQPLGRQEGKDDVPAMLAKNEFVMTADAVRAAGGGSIEKGAQKMYDTMKKLESRVS